MMFRITNFDIRMQSEESSSMSFNTQLDDLSVGFHAELKDSSGSSAVDRINANNGTIGGSPTLNQTGGGNDGDGAIEFGGSLREYVSWTGGQTVDGENWNDSTRSDRTWGIAFRTDAASTAQTLLQLGGRNAGIHTYIASADTIYINATNGTTLNYFNNHGTISNNTWYFLVNVQRDSSDVIDSYLFDADGHVSTIQVDITSFSTETMYDLISIGTACGTINNNDANIRNHADYDGWDEGEKFFDGKKQDLFYIPGTAITEAQAWDLAQSFFEDLASGAPAIANSLTVTQDSNTDNVSADISGWTLAEGDLLIVAATIDGAEAGNTAITQTGFTEHYSTQTSNSLITGCLYSKELASGDTSWTSIDLTWTNNEKAVMRVWRIAAAEHDGIDVVATPNTNDASATPSIPAITLGTNSKAIAIAHLNGSATVDVNPAWYITDDQTTAAGGGPSTQWSGFDELSGSQSTDAFTISSAQASVVSVIGIADATGGGDDHTLSTNELGVSTLLDVSSIVQNHVLTPVDGSVTVSLDSTTLDQVGILAPDELSVTVSLDATTITQVHTLSPDDLSSASTLDTTTITPENDDHTFAPDDLSVSITIDTTSITQAVILSPNDLSVSAVIDTGSISQLQVLAPNDMTVTTTIDTTLVILPSDVSTASISLGALYTGSVSLGDF